MITVTRGDTLALNFQRLDADGEIITTIADAAYFTVKEDYDTEDYLIQKTIDDMTFDEDYVYHFTISATETAELDYGKYICDLEVTQDGVVTTIAKDTINVTKEATWSANK